MRDQNPHGPGSPPPGEGWERPPASVTRGRFGEPRHAGPGSHTGPPGSNGNRYGHTNGHHAPTPVGRRFAEVDEDGPVDLVELQADDELINALSSGLGVSGPGRMGYSPDDRLVAMLASWKAEVDEVPVPELVDTDEAVRMLQPAKPSRKVTFLRPLVAAAAVAACALAVVSISAHEAQPGDALWGVTRVLYSEHAQQVQAQTDLREGIERVNAKLAAGDTVGAQRDLAQLGPLVGQVGPEQQAYFDDQQRFLTAKVAETPQGVRTDPQAPLRDGTPAPRPPVTEGAADPPEPGTTQPGPAPAPGTSTPGAGTGSPPPESGSPSPSDPRMLQGPGSEPGSSTPTTPSESSETSPTTEGAQDPTTTTTESRPTAAGEGGADPTGPSSSSPASSTSTGAVSSTPN